VAALLVVFFHAAGNLAKEKYFGAAASSLETFFRFGGEAGVAFFFVLSGFILHHIHARDFGHPERYRSYFYKRLARIYPTYWIVFLSVTLVAAALPSSRDKIPADVTVIASALLLLPQDPSVVGGTGAPVLVVAWSLQYEMLFYITFSLALIRSWLFYTAVMIFACNLAIEPVLGPYSFPRSFLANPLILLFAVGVCSSIAIRHKVLMAFPRCLVGTSLAIFFAVAFITTQNPGENRFLLDLAYGMSSAILIIGLVGWEQTSTLRRYLGCFGIMGDSSYALYLIHFPLIAILSKFTSDLLPKDAVGVSLAFAFLVVGSVLAALAYTIAIERPMRRRLAGKSGE
jgi:peptidoglycan/LPS O-acetylase OafA/YrhL